MPLASGCQISVCSESLDTAWRRHFIFRPSLNHTNSIICIELHTHMRLRVWKALHLERCFTTTDFISCLANGGKNCTTTLSYTIRWDGASQLKTFLVSPFKWERTSCYTEAQHKSLMGYLNQNYITLLNQTTQMIFMSKIKHAYTYRPHLIFIRLWLRAFKNSSLAMIPTVTLASLNHRYSPAKTLRTWELR